MTAEQRLIRRLRRAADLSAEMDKIEAEIRAKVRREIAKAAPSREAKQATREERLATLSRIRKALHAESGGRCVICGGNVYLAVMHAHHIIGGSSRRSEERQKTMAPTHGKCHDIAHGKSGADPLPALLSLRSWCAVSGRDVAARALAHRIAKIGESRASQRRSAP